MSPSPPHDQKFSALLQMWSTALASASLEPIAARVPQVARLAAASDHLVQDAVISLTLAGFEINQDLIRVRAEALFPPDPQDPWPPPDPAARIQAPAPREYLPGEVDPVTLAAVDGYLACQRQFKATVMRLLQGDPPGATLADDVPRWAAALLRPWSQTGLLSPAGPLGFRTRGGPVGNPAPALIHPQAIPACLETLWTWPGLPGHPLLAELGLLKICPWPAGSGRLARLAHAALALASGRPWPLPGRVDAAAYASATAAVLSGDPLPLARFYRL